MPIRTSEAEWRGTLTEGQGHVKLGSGAYEGPYSYKSRFEEGTGTNPEELIGAAHAGCYSMALSAMLTNAGFTPARIHTIAHIHLDKVGDGFSITRSDLDCEAQIPGIDDANFQKLADAAKQGCPVSKALAGVQITLDARLV